MKKMSHNSRSDLVMSVAGCLHWFDKNMLVRWFEGREAKRHRQIEKILRRFSLNGKLKTMRYGNKLIYSLPRKSRKVDGSKVYHGLCCSECTVRIYRSNTACEIIPERFFFGHGAIADVGFRFPNGSLLCLEFCTHSNYFFSGNMRGKLDAYRRNIEKIEEEFNSEVVVLYVIDIPREQVRQFAMEVTDDYCFFVDYSSFLSVPLGKQLQTPIYYWVDGKEYPLSD